MALSISKDCFPDPSKCHNCLRKPSRVVKRQSKTQKDYKRCSNCHILTYCDQDCQREHWLQVHKSHCRFLSGKSLVKNSKHNAATCIQCIDQVRASPTRLSCENSPATVCNIEEVGMTMKQVLGTLVEFHGEGKKCNCSLKYSFELPFNLGEVSGEYIDIASNGLDAMLAHALKILTAMGIKYKNNLTQVWYDTIYERSCLWYYILVAGKPSAYMSIPSGEHLSDQVNSLQTIYGDSNPWWKALKFSVEFISNIKDSLHSNHRNSDSLKDSRFPHYKLMHEYKQSQLQNQAMVCAKKLLPNYMFWPRLANGSMAIMLPPGTRCQSCLAELCGEVAIPPHKSHESLPNLFFFFGENGALITCCPVAKKPNCWKECIFKIVPSRIRSDEDQWKEYLKEKDILGIDSRDCDFCLKSSLSSHRCKDCLTVQYCSTACQENDLEFHKSVCSTWAKDKSRRIPGKGKQKERSKKLLRDIV